MAPRDAYKTKSEARKYFTLIAYKILYLKHLMLFYMHDGLTEGTFKKRYNNHTSSFRNEKHKHATELSKYVWELKELDV